VNSLEKSDSGGSGTVLIADDNLEDVQLTQRVIASVSPRLKSVGVSSGEELLSYLKGEDKFSDRTAFPYPVLILLDLLMPGMHGFEVLRWLGSHPPHNLIPVVVLTVSGETLVARQSYALGARSFLAKPLKPDDFKETIRKFDLSGEEGPETPASFQRTASRLMK
jgi:CheY-like chemotaxis protein